MILGPFYAGGEIANHRIEPHVQSSGFPTIQRDSHTPINIAGDGATVQPVHNEVAAEAHHVRAPVRLVLIQILDQFRLEASQIKEEMFALAHDQLIRRVAFVTRINQLGRIQQIAAVVALVAARIGIVADVTFAFYVAIRQVALFSSSLYISA